MRDEGYNLAQLNNSGQVEEDWQAIRALQDRRRAMDYLAESTAQRTAKHLFDEQDRRNRAAYRADQKMVHNVLLSMVVFVVVIGLMILIISAACSIH